MGIANYRLTGGPYVHFADKQKHDDWAAAWTKTIAEAVDGLDTSERWQIYSIVHEIRRRVAAGDYGPPESYPAPYNRGQAEMDLKL